MAEFRVLASRNPAPIGAVLILLLGLCLVSDGQVYYPNQEVHINDLASLKAKSDTPSDVLLTSLEIVLRENQICCAKTSALVDNAQSADAGSLADVASKLQGRHLMSDGRPITVTAEFYPPASINSGQLIKTIIDGRAPLLEWNSHLYVVYGVVYDKTVDYASGGTMDAIRRILLLDPRFADKRREVFFDRLTDNWRNVQGLLMVKAAHE